MDEEIKPHESDEAKAMYHASKRENTMNDICKGTFDFLKLEPNDPDRKYWEEVYKKASEVRKQYQKIKEVLLEVLIFIVLFFLYSQ